MSRISKLSNLYRLNFKNQWIVCVYLIKTVFNIKPTIQQNEIYIYYNYLINNDGYFFKETVNFITSNFKGNAQKRIKLRKLPSSDFDVFQQIYFWKEYLPAIDTYKNNFAKPNNYRVNIIDAGGNIGLTSLFFLEHFNNCQIICLEPEIENFKILDYNLPNSDLNNIKKINAAIWSKNAKIKIVKDFRDKLDWSFRVEETEDLNSIDAFSFNQIVKENKLEFIDILKIDIEGSEKEIFTSSNMNLDFLKITKCIAMEIHDEFNCREEIYIVLRKYGFKFFNQGELIIGYNQNLALV